MQEAVTRLLQKPDGTEALVIRTATLTVVAGPDKGAEFRIDRGRVTIGSGPDCDVQLNDSAVSRYHAEIKPTERGYLLRDLDSTNGTIVGGMRVIEALIGGSASLALGESVLQLSPTAEQVEIALSLRSSFGELIGQSPSMREVFAILERVAPSEATVLLEGPSGTGKEVAACSIHEHSTRRDGPFVVVDCGAIPSSLIESELFGHERGAFTGAADARVGAFEEADGGTVFLDEIGELDLELQPRLLRFLEGRQVKRVGAARHRRVDVRVIAATNKRLTEEIRGGTFREDLYYRLSVVRIELPPLRDRPEDVRLLAHHFARRFGPDSRQIVTDEIETLLTSYSWPGNVRQLRHVIEQLAVMPELATRALREEAVSPLSPSIGRLIDSEFHEGRRQWQEIFDRQYLVERLERAGGVVARAAAAAGLPRQTFYKLLNRHGINAKPD